MLSKKEIKDIQSLGHKKSRDESGLFLAEGPKVTGELLRMPAVSAVHVYCTPQWLPALEGLHAAVPLTVVSEGEMEKISFLQTPQGVLALFRIPAPVTPPEEGLLLYLDGIQDPGNLGTLIRIADWFGLEGVVLSEGCADPYSPKGVQASAASIGRVPVFRDEEGSFVLNTRLPLMAAALEGRPVSELGTVKRGLLLIGSEGRGLRPSLLARAAEKITIPGRGGAESLNAAVAAGIILSHIRG